MAEIIDAEDWQVIENEEVSIVGSGKGSGGGGGSVENDDTLISSMRVTIIDLLGEGEIGGLVDGAKSIYANNTQVQSSINRPNGDPRYNFKNVEWDQRTGTQSQTPFENVSDIETPHTLGVEVTKNSPVTFTVTNTDVDWLRIILEFQSMITINDKGDISGSEVHNAIRISTDNGPFVNAVTLGGRTLDNHRIVGKSRGRYQYQYSVRLPPATSKWDVRVIRLTDDATTSKVSNKYSVAAYVEVIDSRLSYPNSALVKVKLNPAQFSRIPSRSYIVSGLRIRVPSNYNSTTNTYSGIWDGTFQILSSENPAWILYDLLTNKRYGLGEYVASFQIDKGTLYAIGVYCDGLVPDGKGGFEKRFTINTQITTQKEAYALISDITSVFRGMAFPYQGMIGFTYDAPTNPSHIFTNANVVDGDFNYASTSRSQIFSVALVTWNDPAQNFRQQIEYVEDRTLLEKYGYRKTEILAFGCTTRGQAQRVGKWLLSTIGNAVTFEVGHDAAFMIPGEVAEIQDQYRAGTRLGGRIKSATANSAVLDAPIQIIQFGMQIDFTMPDGSIQRRVINETGTTDTVTWFINLPDIPIVGSVFVGRQPGIIVPMQVRILAIQQNADRGTFSISAVEHNPNKYAEIELGIKIAEVPTSLLTNLIADPSNLRFDVNTQVVGAKTLTYILGVAWDGKWPNYRFKWRVTSYETGGTTNWTEVITDHSWYEIPNVSPGVYEVSVVGTTPAGNISDELVGGYSFASTTEKPAAPTNLIAFGDFRQIILRWTNPPTTNIDIDRIEIFVNTVDNVTTAQYLDRTNGSTYTHTGLLPNQTRFYWVRSVSIWGVASDFNSNAGTSATTIIEANYFIAILNRILSETDLSKQLAVDFTKTLEEFLRFQSTFYDYDKETKNRLLLLEEKTANTLARIQQDAIVRADESSALASYVSTIFASQKENFAAIQQETTARASANSALASQQTTLQTTLNGHTNAIQIAATSIDGLRGQYTVKIGQDGYISGFGLASELKNGAVTSYFLINASYFAVGAPGASRLLDSNGNPASQDDTQAVYPFIVVAEPGGRDIVDSTGQIVHIPQGTYMNNAIIANATIDNAKIGRIIRSNNYIEGNHSVPGWAIDKNGKLTINGGSIEIYNSAGNLIFNSGSQNPLGALATQNAVNAAQVAGLGALATQNSVNTSQITGLGAMAFLNSIGLGNYATYISVLGGEVIAAGTLYADRIVSGSLGVVTRYNYMPTDTPGAGVTLPEAGGFVFNETYTFNFPGASVALDIQFSFSCPLALTQVFVSKGPSLPGDALQYSFGQAGANGQYDARHFCGSLRVQYSGGAVAPTSIAIQVFAAHNAGGPRAFDYRQMTITERRL